MTSKGMVKSGIVRTGRVLMDFFKAKKADDATGGQLNDVDLSKSVNGPAIMV